MNVPSCKELAGGHSAAYLTPTPAPPMFNTSAVHGRAPPSAPHRSKATRRSTKPKPKTKKAKKGSSWTDVFCSGDGGQLPLPSWLTGGHYSRSRKSSKSRKPTYSVYSDGGSVARLSLASSDSSGDEWELPPTYYRGHRDRRGPSKAGNDELEIAMRDLFPCLGDVFDMCGCSKPKKKPRMRTVDRSGSFGTKPQLETVCLECGNTLECHHLPQSLMRDANSRYDFSYTQQHMYHDIPQKQKAHKGYKKWEYADAGGISRGHEPDRVPLPSFGVAASRQLQHRPGAAGRQEGMWMDSDYFAADTRGKVKLPDFENRSIRSVSSETSGSFDA